MADPTPAVATRSELRPELASWPEPVRAELGRRANIVRHRAGLGALDLDDPNARALVVKKGASLEAGPDETGGFPAIVSIAALVEFADLPAAIRGIGRLLRPDGELFFIEPVARPGWTGVAAASAGSVLRPLRDQHLGRDVPLAIRATPFIITDIERFTMPALLWPLRPFVQGRAKRFPGVEA